MWFFRSSSENTGPTAQSITYLFVTQKGPVGAVDDHIVRERLQFSVALLDQNKLFLWEAEIKWGKLYFCCPHVVQNVAFEGWKMCK